MSSSIPLHNEFKLFKEDTRYILVPTITFQKDAKPLVVDRPSASILADGTLAFFYPMLQRAIGL
jgi:hypothetical protein